MSPADIKDDHEREHKKSRYSSFRKPPAVFPFLKRIKGESLRLETFTFIPHFESQLKAPEFCSKWERKSKLFKSNHHNVWVWGSNKDFSFLLFPPKPHSTYISPSEAESQYLEEFIRRYSNLNYSPIPPNLENPESVSKSVPCLKQMSKARRRWQAGSLSDNQVRKILTKQGTLLGLLSRLVQQNSQRNQRLWFRQLLNKWRLEKWVFSWLDNFLETFPVLELLFTNTSLCHWVIQLFFLIVIKSNGQEEGCRKYRN